MKCQALIDLYYVLVIRGNRTLNLALGKFALFKTALFKDLLHHINIQQNNISCVWSSGGSRRTMKQEWIFLLVVVRENRNSVWFGPNFFELSSISSDFLPNFVGLMFDKNPRFGFRKVRISVMRVWVRVNTSMKLAKRNEFSIHMISWVGGIMLIFTWKSIY